MFMCNKQEWVQIYYKLQVKSNEYDWNFKYIAPVSNLEFKKWKYKYSIV